jgi:hypothetical protein
MSYIEDHDLDEHEESATMAPNPKAPALFPELAHVKDNDWDEWIKNAKMRLVKRGYREHAGQLSNEDFVFWKTFEADDGQKLFMSGVLFYDFRKFSQLDPSANKIGIQYKCMLLGGSRIDMDVSDDYTTLDQFEQMCHDFFLGLFMYQKNEK